MDATTVNIETITPRGAPAFATPSPPESCILSSSSEHLPPSSMQPNLETVEQQQQQQQQRRVTVTTSRSITKTTPSSTVLADRTNPSPFTMNTSDHSENPQTNGTTTNMSMYQSTTATENKPQHMSTNSGQREEIVNHPSQHTVDHPPPMTSTVSSGGTTAFPSLPPCASTDQIGGNGSGGSLQRNKRPTRDRVLRMLSDALMRRSLTMVSEIVGIHVFKNYFFSSFYSFLFILFSLNVASQCVFLTSVFIVIFLSF